jgi:hypothetical protein
MPVIDLKRRYLFCNYHGGQIQTRARFPHGTPKYASTRATPVVPLTPRTMAV